MLPCQSSCCAYQDGCHKTCERWKKFQENQRIQRRAKKEYMKFYNDLCAAVTRQLSSLTPRRSVW